MAVIISCSVCADALAAFGGLVPLSWSGALVYTYGYSDHAGNESETTGLSLELGASGYVWRPWFAATSVALNVGLSNSETSTSSSDAMAASGSFSLGVFPGSRFPFSLSYTRSDSRSQSFQDVSRISGETAFSVTRLSLRQRYRPRRSNQLYSFYYSSTEFDAEAFDSESVSYGVDYSLRFSRHSLAVNASHSESTSSSNSNVPSTDVSSLSHVYTPSNELGVNNLVSHVQVDPGDGGAVSKNSQVFSSFYWRPEYRSINVSGGVRLSEDRAEGAASTVSRSLNTSLGLGYRITRSLNLSANASVGTTDSNNTQILATTQTASLVYSGASQQLAGFSYGWQWGGGMSNSNIRTEIAGNTDSSDQQSLSSSIGHNLNKQWALSQRASVNAGFSQSVSGSKSSELDVVTKTVNHGFNLSWNRRGQRGSTYVSTRLSDSRGYGIKDSVYDHFGVTLNSDYTINRLSSLSGDMDFSASHNESENEVGENVVTGSRLLNGGMSYRNSRPFGVYNLKFSSSLTGSKQIDSADPATVLRWEGTFRYSLGLLSTSLGLLATKSANGGVTKSMNFQATRTF